MKGMTRNRVMLIALVLLSSLLLLLSSCIRKVEQPSKWRSISELKPKARDTIIEKAKEFGGFIEVSNVTCPKVNASHTRFVNVLGMTKDSVQVMIGVDPETNEVVKMVLFCPRRIKEAEKVEITENLARSKCSEFLESKNLVLPENYALDEAKISTVGTWKRWVFVWRHFENDVHVLPDFIRMEVNATEEGQVILYSKVYHKVEVELTPKLNVKDALKKAQEFMPVVGDYRLKESSLAVVYPNNFYNKQIWEWSEKQALCYILKFNRDKHHILDIWVDAMTGEIHGGEMCHLHAPEVYGIDAVGDSHMKSHMDNIWNPYLDMMNFDVTSFDWSNTAAGFSEATISGAISTGRYFIVEGHGDVTTTAEKMCIAYQGSDDAKSFTPDEVPANNLRFVLLDVCQSGEDGTGLDFKDTFINQGADVFIGFDDYMCAWSYEESLLGYLAEGHHLANAHANAVADVSPWYTIVITYGVGCLNQVRLAPLWVTVTRSPSGSIATSGTFTVTATVTNYESVDHTAATNVTARLDLPAGFSVTTGANPQNIGTANYASPKTATWTVTATAASGSYTLDVEVWSDNLGTEVDDAADPYHKFDVNVVSGGGCSG